MVSSILPVYNRAPLSFVRGEGSWLIEEDGRRFLDLGAGIAVNALGHAHPELTRALSEQAERLWHVSNLYRIPQQESLADRLTAASFADKVFFTNSGTEACEMAVKMARKFWSESPEPRSEIVTFGGAFHGRSTAAISAAGSEKLTKGFAPLLPGFVHLPFGDHEALRAAVGPNTAAILIEPIQGEGGIRMLPDVCLKGLRDLCDETGALLIFDEVQCGMGRTGRLFAHEWAGVTPDIMMVAKGIGGGFPLGAVLATDRASAPMVAGSHGSTYGGNPLACAVGDKVMEIVAEEGFLAEVRRKGAALAQSLLGLVESHPEVFTGLRGTGLMLGLECRPPNTDVLRECYDAGLLAVPGGENVLRILPPLNISDADIAEAVARLDQAAGRLAPA